MLGVSGRSVVADCGWRQVFMILKNGEDELDLVFKFKIEGFDYAVFASSDTTMKCFGCSKIGHLSRNCPDKMNTNTEQIDAGNEAFMQKNWEGMADKVQVVPGIFDRITVPYHAAKRFQFSQRVQLAPGIEDCQKIITLAKSDVLRIQRDLDMDKEGPRTDKTLYRYFCEALLVFKHIQCPQAMEA
ncbi:hypothetical protein PO909_030035 [Leuciscus waleckii]